MKEVLDKQLPSVLPVLVCGCLLLVLSVGYRAGFGIFIGVWLGGVLYEMFGNYDAIWIAGAVLGLIAAILHWPIKEQSHIRSLQRAPVH
ncbi:MAG: hypothetical protein KJO60_01585 [Desulfofustis sp.]|nr:hypothetical protein [Desulfofustis sp.]MBT8353180.1 hypothetical protein [Desulfofustis sp.]